MQFLVIGLGSMGKRRIRNLQALGYSNIVGFDISQKKCDETKSKYTIETFNDFEKAYSVSNPNIFIVSTSPEHHMYYAYIAYERSLHCFIEASVVESEKILALSKMVPQKNLIFAPSCTMQYFTGPKTIKQLIDSNYIGIPLNINYHTGQYLPDWHPWEDIQDFYVSNPHTGGCREIVPFELTWINNIFGSPEVLSCTSQKLSSISANIDDIYHLCLQYPTKILANITVEVISRPFATRYLKILGTEGMITFYGDLNEIHYSNISDNKNVIIELSKGNCEQGYINPEEPYINEMQDFIEAIKHSDPSLFPNSLLKDYNILSILYEAELKSGNNNDLSK